MQTLWLPPPGGTRESSSMWSDVRTNTSILADGKGRPLDKPKRKKRKHTRKILRSETRVADKLRLGDKVLNSELRRDLAYLSREMQSNNLGGF